MKGKGVNMEKVWVVYDKDDYAELYKSRESAVTAALDLFESYYYGNSSKDIETKNKDRNTLLKEIAKGGSFYLDDILYCKSKELWD